MQRVINFIYACMYVVQEEILTIMDAYGSLTDFYYIISLTVFPQSRITNTLDLQCDTFSIFFDIFNRSAAIVNVG